MNSRIIFFALTAFFICAVSLINPAYSQIRPGATAKAKQQKKPGNESQLFDKLDLNKDGKVSREEVAESNFIPLKDNFNAIDRNKSGDLSREEVKNAHNYMASKPAQKSTSKSHSVKVILDTNGDGKYSRTEVIKGSNKFYKTNFNAIDVNKDGYLTNSEINAFKKSQTNKPVKKK